MNKDRIKYLKSLNDKILLIEEKEKLEIELGKKEIECEILKIALEYAVDDLQEADFVNLDTQFYIDAVLENFNISKDYFGG